MPKLPGKGDHGWRPISAAPFDHEIELAVINQNGIHALVFPCCRILNGWVKAKTRERIEIYPTHWRAWVQKP